MRLLLVGLSAAAAALAFPIDLAKTGALVAAPRAAAGQAVRLATALRDAGCAAPETAVDDAAPPRNRPLILLGSAPTNRLLRRVYEAAYDLTDNVFPGPGNASVRTVPDPLDTGADAIVVGASDAAGLALAVDLFIRQVKTSGCKLGYFNRLAAEPVPNPYAQYLDPTFDWAATETGPGAWDYMRAVARAGLGYLYTGNEAYLAVFRDQIRTFYQHCVLTRASKPQLHGFTHWMVNVWDLISPHPFFDSSRTEIDNILLTVLRSPTEGARRLASEALHNQIRGNHSTRSGLDAYFGGRWAWRRLHLAEGREWMEIAARFFAPQLTSSKPAEDSWGHQWNASLINTAVYALATGNRDYFASPALRQAAERALIAHSHRERGPSGYLSLVAEATGDPRYLSLIRAVDPALSAKSFVPTTGDADEFLRAFAFFREAPFHEGALGVAVAPLDRLWYDTIDTISSLSPAGAFARTVPFEDTFDKLCFREGYGANDFYLLFDGLSGGAHGYQDANCIKRYVEGGVDWLGVGQDSGGPSTVRQENGVYLALDGAGPGRVHRFARKLYAHERGGYMFAAGTLTGVGDADWERHIVRRKGRWTAVVDRAVARRPGEILFERHWWVKGAARVENGWVASRSGSVWFHLGAAGVAETALSGRGRLERIRKRVEAPGEAVEAAALLYVDRQAAAGRYRIVRTSRGWVVTGEGENILLGRGEVEALAAALPELPQPAPPAREYRALAPDWQTAQLPAAVTAVAPVAGSWAAGDRAGNVRWGSVSIKRPAAISALHYYPGGGAVAPGLLAGEEDGTLSLIDRDGTLRWSVKMPLIPGPFAYWGEGRTRAREIDSADLDGGGIPEILVANSDHYLWAFDAKGQRRFRSSVEWGVFTAMLPARIAGQMRILGGGSRPSIFGRVLAFDGQGAVAGTFTRPDLADWSFPSSTRDVRLTDSGVLAAIDTSMRQLILFREDGKIAWEADVAGGPAAIAQLPNRVVCATGAGYVISFDTAGRRQWTRFFGENARLLVRRGDGVDAITDKDLFRFGPGGETLGRTRLPAAVSAVPRPGSHRAGDRLLLGLEDGTVAFRP